VLQSQESLIADYKYIVCDFVTNEVLAEIPFLDVSYSRALKDAGTFEGSIPIMNFEESYAGTYNIDLYGATIPGKTTLYVLRNNVCVWGGIIWTRSYNIKDRMLHIGASEMTSYLHHRVMWRTRSDDYSASVSVYGGIATVTVDFTYNNKVNFAVGDLVYLKLIDINYAGYYTIASKIDDNNFTVFVTGKNAYDDSVTLVNYFNEAAEGGTTVQFFADTFEYARSVLNDLNVDYFDSSRFIQNELSDPGVRNLDTVTTISSNGAGKAVITLSNADAYTDYVLGQGIKLINTNSTYDGVHRIISSGVDSNGFDVAYKLNSSNQVTITIDAPAPGGTESFSVNAHALTNYLIAYSKVHKKNYLTVKTRFNHNMSVGDEVVISGAVKSNGIPLDDTYTVYRVIDAKQLQFETVLSPTTKTTNPTGGTISRTPTLYSNSSGEYTAQSNMLFDFNTLASSENGSASSYLKGSDLMYVGDILDNYSNNIKGFEYRIDCSYDEATKKFSRTFVLLSYYPPEYEAYIGHKSYTGVYHSDNLPLPYPASAFGADRIVFEHPGNILDLTLEESAEDTATRFWVQGNNPDAADEFAEQPVVGVTNKQYLRMGWPILDQIESQKDTIAETQLQEFAIHYLNQSTPPHGVFNITVNGSMHPFIGSYAPGDWCSIVVNGDQFLMFRLQSAYEPRSNVIIRKIINYQVQVPNNPSYPEQVQLQLITESQVDINGYSA
jgi:hypothetical protein